MDTYELDLQALGAAGGFVNLARRRRPITSERA
jgi:hypothetical protein